MLVAHTMLIFNSSNANYNDARVKECYLEVHKEYETNYSNTGYYCTYIVLTPLCMKPPVRLNMGDNLHALRHDSDVSEKTAFQLVGSNKTACSNWKRQILLSACICRGSWEFMSIAGHGSGDIVSPRTVFSHFHSHPRVHSAREPMHKGVKASAALSQLSPTKHGKTCTRIPNAQFERTQFVSCHTQTVHLISALPWPVLNCHKNLLLFLILSSGHYVRTYSWEMDGSQ